MLYFAADDVFHAEAFEGYVLLPDVSEMAVYLPSEESSFQVFEGKVVELQDSEVVTKKPGVFVGLQLFSE